MLNKVMQGYLSVQNPHMHALTKQHPIMEALTYTEEEIVCMIKKLEELLKFAKEKDNIDGMLSVQNQIEFVQTYTATDAVVLEAIEDLADA